MAFLQANDPVRSITPEHSPVTNLDHTSSIEDELDGIVRSLQDMIAHGTPPDILMTSCMAYLARCTEIHLQLIRIEARVRKARQLRTQQLAKVMELIDFAFRGGSRLIEIRRQEIELSK